MKFRIILFFLFFLFRSLSFAQSEDYFFNNAARAYIKNIDSVCLYLKQGLQKYPNSKKLYKLAEKGGCKPNEMINGDDDKDGVLNNVDNCPKQYGSKKNSGCPETTITDRDNDGITDDKDSCPDISGPLSNKGCPKEPVPPVKDSDGDGIPDNQDNCPYEKGSKTNNGCPYKEKDKDSDGDGIPDSRDGCPYEQGPSDSRGCPQKQPPVGPQKIAVNLHCVGNEISWNSALTKNASDIKITFQDKNGIFWMRDVNVTGKNSYKYCPNDGRAGGIKTTVTLSITMKKGYFIEGSNILSNKIFNCNCDD
jgi:hypothetical protein